MATNKKIPSQGNLVDMLAAFGRGALGTLTDRFNQYDAALESVATHDTVIEKLTRNKAEWFDAGYITADTCYNIVTGAQPSVTLPLDASELLNRFRAVASRTRLYAGVRFTVQGKEDVCLYLKFAAISPYADSGAVVFEDLQFCYSPTEEGVEDIDVRYKVRTDKSTGGIVLEKVEESAGAAELPWLDVTPQSEEEFDKFVVAFMQEAGLHGKADYELNLNASTDLTQYRGIRIDLGEGNVVETPVVATVGNGFICAPAFLSDNEFVFGITKETGGKFTLHIYNLSSQYANVLSDYAKKTDIPEKPFTFYLNGDVLGYNPNDYANGINFKLQIPATISTNLNTCCKQYLERTSNAASTATSITSEDPGTKLPQFYLLFGKGNSAFRFQCDGVHQSGSALYFHGEIRNTSNYAYYDAYWIQGDSYIVFRKVLNIYFASGGAAS